MFAIAAFVAFSLSWQLPSISTVQHRLQGSAFTCTFCKPDPVAAGYHPSSGFSGLAK
jgi:hypothetical protein